MAQVLVASWGSRGQPDPPHPCLQPAGRGAGALGLSPAQATYTTQGSTKAEGGAKPSTLCSLKLQKKRKETDRHIDRGQTEDADAAVMLTHVGCAEGHGDVAGL